MKYYGTWSTNNGNTWSNNRYYANSITGVKRILSKIIDGNLTSYHDSGKGTIFEASDNIDTVMPPRPVYTGFRTRGKWTEDNN